MLKIAVCDDDKAVCEKIENASMTYGEKANIQITVSSCDTGKELIKLLLADKGVNLIFLDIFLRLESGVEIARYIREELNNQGVQIVYISSIDTPRPEMFEARPMNFLGKPVVDEKIHAEIEKYIRLAKGKDRTFDYKIGGELHKRCLEEIIYFESLSRQIRIVFVEGTETFYGKMSDVSDELKDAGFNYIHRSFIVNARHIEKYTREYVFMSNGDKLPISKAMSKDLKIFLMDNE